MKNKGLTASFIFEAFGANYGENYGNITVLKKISRGNGDMYSYISRQALRYNVVQQCEWDTTPVTGENTVVQFAPSATIQEYPEIDLFGFMKTKSGSGAATRSAVVRISHAVALEPYNGDMDYLTNMGLARRQNLNNAIAQSEIQRTFYAYTITIDLDLVGVEKDLAGNELSPSIDNKEKSKRVNQLLSTLQYLYRDIKGRRENLAPVFAIGGVYERKTPFFDGRLILHKGALNTEVIKGMLDSEPLIGDNTIIGYIDGFFTNHEEIKSTLPVKPIPEFFNQLTKKVEEYYDESC
jgi:CRISPR-associated protein Cst2